MKSRQQAGRIGFILRVIPGSSIYIVSLLLLLSSPCFTAGQETPNEQQQRIPTTLSEAHAELERILSPEELAKIDAMPSEDGMSKYHFGLGLSIRNGWGLWRDSPLAKHMKQLGFTHPDIMSSEILRTFWCKRHGQDFRLEEHAAASKKSVEPAQNTWEEEEDRVQRAKKAIRNMMIGLQFERRNVPVVRMPDRGTHHERARFLSPFLAGVFISVYRHTGMEENLWVTRGCYFDPTDCKIHEIRVAEVNDVRSAVVAGRMAWFAGNTNGQALLVGVNGRNRVAVPLPQAGEPPQLGLDGQSLLAVYPKAVFRLADRMWTLVYSGDIQLPRSGLPPQMHGNLIFFRDEGYGESKKRLWWLTLGEDASLTALDGDTGLVGPKGPRWENSFSYCVTKSADLWACVGDSSARKWLLRRARDGSYSIAIMNNSVQFTDNLFGSSETDQGLSVSAVAALPDDSLLLVGDRGLYRLKGQELIQELVFTNTRQEVSDPSGRVVLHWHWDPSNVLVLDDRSYFISGTFGGIYLLRKGSDGTWSFLSLDDKLGEPTVW